jgi:hypothetical protein
MDRSFLFDQLGDLRRENKPGAVILQGIEICGARMVRKRLSPRKKC